MSVEELKINDYERSISTGKCVVAFYAPECVRCEEVTRILKYLPKDWEGLKFYNFNGKQPMADLLVQDLKLNWLPRILFYSEGKEVGRILLFTIPIPQYEQYFREKIQEFCSTGKVNHCIEDNEALADFSNRVQKALGWEKVTGKDPKVVWKATTTSLIAELIVKANANWGLMSLEELTPIAQDYLKRIEVGAIATPEYETIENEDGSRIARRKPEPQEVTP